MQLSRGPAPHFVKGASLVGHQGLIRWVLAALFLCQVVFYFVANSTLKKEKEQDAWALCADGRQGAGSSEQCAEVELFRSWRDAHEEDLLLRVSPRSGGGRGDRGAEDAEDVADDAASKPQPQQKQASSEPPLASTAGTSKPSLGRSRSATPAPEQQPAMEQPLPDASAEQAVNVTEWAQGLIDLQASYQSRLSGLLEHHKRLHPEAAERVKPLLEQIMEVGRQMCSDAAHHDRPECADFVRQQALANSSSDNGSASSHEARHAAMRARDEVRSKTMAELNGRLHDLEESEHAWEKAFSDKANSFARELCRDPSRRGYAACAEFFKDDTQPPAPRSALRGSPERWPVASGDLHWSNVADWKALGSGLRGRAELPVVNEAELAHAHWMGTIPKVACVAVVPCGRMVKPWIKYFIDNFNSQQYEGPRQLVLVYHYLHAEAASAIKMYADGTFIKAVAARDPEYPSASTFRFGAWNADAQVVARWDFDAWHHRQRLSLQIRSMASAQRPVSLLREWSVRAPSGDLRVVSGGRNWDSSLVGEVSWMRTHWFPSMEEGRVALEATVAQYAVHVNASDLSVYDEATHELAAERCHFDGDEE